MNRSLIEVQFPVSKLSKESYKERKAVAGQTLTGIGKWWGRKPLILVRATILGLLLPATDDPEKDREIFLKILTMDDEGLLLRKGKPIPVTILQENATPAEIQRYFDPDGGWRSSINHEDKQEFEKVIFQRNLNYDQKLEYCHRPEQVEGPSVESWNTINAHLGTRARNLNELIAELGTRQFGNIPRVGDAFCGGGSIPFEAARIGCETFGSDLNPAAALLTWASLNIVGGGPEVYEKVITAQETVFTKVDKQITEWGIEHNEEGWRADAYLYCAEIKNPKTGYMIPLSPTWIVSEKFKVCAILEPDHETKRYRIKIVTNATDELFENARNGTIANSELIDPMEPDSRIPISTIRGDRTINGKVVYGLRMWENEDIIPNKNDVFQERLYCIRYIERFFEVKKNFTQGKRKFSKGQIITINDSKKINRLDDLISNDTLKGSNKRHFIEPNENDYVRENKVGQYLKERFTYWQKMGYIPSNKIVFGVETDRLQRERGWTHWHHLFNPRQLLINGLFNSVLNEVDFINRIKPLIIARISNINSRLCRWLQTQGGGIGGGKETFDNQALNTLFNYSCRTFNTLLSAKVNFPTLKKIEESLIFTADARNISYESDFFITDPPYADAVNYHELGDYFLSWYEKQLKKNFPEWYTDSKAALAVKGSGKSFNRSMLECYSNFTRHMPDNGAQVVMFTHQDASVWADLALILWASGLQVTAAWTIQTETDATGIKKGNYVQGTVIMVLRKQTSSETAFLSDIQADVEFEVKHQIKQMLAIDDQDDPNFGDTDYQLAAYVAALRVITGYRNIEDMDVKYELERERNPSEKSELERIIEDAIRIAMNELVPTGFRENNWRRLSPEERFYLKGLDLEYKSEYRNGVYQEMARGFGLHDYRYMLNTNKANQTRLYTSIEFKNRDLGTEGFSNSLVRNILFAIHETSINEDPMTGRNWLHTELADYWERRELILDIFRYIDSRCHYLEHWKGDITALDLLKGRIENDRV
ncbi:MAG: DUF1156 domain-containing protein [Bacteroidetes bacterium]|nr:DUF1156 domain-containing protein [Bacteroidota bacterium]